jgi:acetate kinase
MSNTTPRLTLAINAGSSSLKCALFTLAADPQLVARGSIDGADAERVSGLIDWIAAYVGRSVVAAVGHRIVHGGAKYRDPQRITTALLSDLGTLVPFAPNHLPAELDLIEAMRHHLPDVPQVACFDTAFHRTMPDVARRLPIPAVYDARGVQRYGFHGLSYEYLIGECRRLETSDRADGRVILAHLGNGSSLAAVARGHSIETTMGFTPIGGVPMSTRSGDLDPGAVTFLAREDRLTADQLEDLLSRRSGLAAIAGGSGDMRTLLEREAGDPSSRLALEAFVYGVVKAIGALTAVLRGLDLLVFSGGIGEHAPSIRSRICEPFAFLGIALDTSLNQANAAIISSPASRVTVRVIPTDEQLVIARAASRLLGTE